MSAALFALAHAVGSVCGCGPSPEQGTQEVEAGAGELGGIEHGRGVTEGLLVRHPQPAGEWIGGHTQAGQDGGGLPGGALAPLADRGEGVVADSGHRADHDAQQGRQLIAPSPAVARVRDRGQLGEQIGGFTLRAGRSAAAWPRQ